MKLIKKDNDMRARSYVWALDEIKTKKDCLRLVESLAKIGKLDGIEFSGYEDMDEHGNWATFDSLEEFKNGSKDVWKIEPNSVDVRADYNGVPVFLTINPIWDNDKGTQMRMMCNPSIEGEIIKGVEKAVKEAIE